MLPSPRLNAGHLIWAFEVILVLRLGVPPGLGLAFALAATSRLRTKALMAPITRIRSEEDFAMQALTEAAGRRHSGGKKTYRPSKRHPELRSPTRFRKKIQEENGRRMKKKFS